VYDFSILTVVLFRLHTELLDWSTQWDDVTHVTTKYGIASQRLGSPYWHGVWLNCMAIYVVPWKSYCESWTKRS